MSLPPFLTRIQNAAGPLLSGIGESELGERLSGHSLLLEIDEAAAEDPGQRAGYLLAANLGARLYPRLSLDAPEALREEAVTLARSINAGCTFGPPPGPASTLSWRGGEATAERVTVRAKDWNIALDGDEAASDSANPLAAMAAAAIGVGELFRALFADLLPHGRIEAEPFEINLLTLGEPTDIPTLPDLIELGEIHLAGCGAIGQAFIAALRELPLSGKIVAVDHESLDEGNLQRYLLSIAADVGTPKSELVERALEASSVEVEPLSERWGESERSGPGQETVVSALDSKQGRIELQAGLPREIFNAWTQPQDIGVSRHQHFGEEPCLACLGWPKHARPSQSVMISEALGESELRVLRYLGSKTPVGQPLPADQIQPTGRLPLPEDAPKWGERSLLEDLIERYGLPPEPLQELAVLPIENLYRDAVCAGMLIEHGNAADRAAEVSVPLAHQSALAGIMLAAWLIVDRVPALRELRPAETQARYDVLRGGEQVWPRQRGRTERCLCADPDFRDAYRERWATDSSEAC
ncbi:MAG TPA: ThiF family adenylyltransferase [Solirubrobacterales bacterium]